ncbi:MAG: DUF1461 domain-containing protein [Lachnospiraceae bacterium]|nr:DUF1461 domain-containing protein [Lachnospiraceae bacterium]
MRKFLWIPAALSCVILPLLILVAVCYVDFTSPGFYFRFNEQSPGKSFEESLSVSRKEAYDAIRFMLSYVKGKEKTDNTYIDVGGSSEPFFNGRELAHLSDIRRLIQKGKLIALMAAIISIPGIVLIILRKEYVLLAKVYPIAQAAAIALIALAAVIFACNPLMFITTLHRLFFGGSDNSWIFNPATDRIVHFFPEGIYLKMITFAAVIFVAETLDFYVLSRIAVKAAKKKK